MVRTLLLAVVLGLVAPACEAQTSVRQVASGTAPPAPASGAPRNVDCPVGLEQVLPGVYYYCAGARNLALGHYASGLSLLEVAAAWGSKPAQFTLGVAYFNGDVAAKNRPLGLAWLGLAAERNDPSYQAIFQSAWHKATSAEQADGNRLWRAMRSKYGDAHAAVRARRHYLYLRGQMISGEAFGAHWCIGGLTGTNMARAHGGGPRGRDSTEVGCTNETSGSVLVNQMDSYAASLFEGMEGHVTVGPLQQVPAPAPPREKAGKQH